MNTSPPPIISTQSLTRNYKETRAVNALDLDIYPGALFGLVGPDGAGKTTTLRLLAGLLAITEGSATIAGFDLESQAEAIKPHIGYMAQQFSLYAELSVLENLQFFSDLYDVPRKELRERTERLLEFAGLTEFKTRRAKNLSGGMQKKLALACTLIHEPEILLLDEPFGALDALTRERLNLELLQLWQASRKTVVMVTHNIQEAVFLADRVLVLSQRPGRVTADISINLPRPRELPLLYDKRFGALAYQVRQAIQ